jgi:hypothetical protein
MIYPSLFWLLMAAMGAGAEDSTLAGGFALEHTTLLNLGFEWQIRGDVNRNATVGVEFRTVGESGWRQALPLVRIGGEDVYWRRENFDYTVPDGFAGSILNLRPGTEYECRFHLTDPDGVSGQTEHTVRVKTRREPQPSREGRTLHVYPPIGQRHQSRPRRGQGGPKPGQIGIDKDITLIEPAADRVLFGKGMQREPEETHTAAQIYPRRSQVKYDGNRLSLAEIAGPAEPHPAEKPGYVLKGHRGPLARVTEVERQRLDGIHCVPGTGRSVHGQELG